MNDFRDYPEVQYPFHKIMITGKLKLVHQFSLLAVIALLVVVGLAFLDFYYKTKVDDLTNRQEHLMSIGHKLTDIEKELLQARLDESQMINSRNLEYLDSFKGKILKIIKVANEVMDRCYTKDIFDAQITMLKHLNQYNDYVNQTLKLQSVMGFDGKNGILVELRTIKDNIQNKLYAIDNKPLDFIFLEMQLLEKDFSNTLDMKLVKRLLTLTLAFTKLLKIGNIPISHKKNLQLYITEYHANVLQLMNKIIETQSSITNSTLQFQLIFPSLQHSQQYISELLAAIEIEFHEQLQTSKLQTIAIFTSAFIILGFLILLQIKNAQFLVQRLHQLTDCMHHIGSGEFNKMPNLPQGSDEIGILANTFEKMALQIKSQITIIEQEREKSEKLLLNILPSPIAKRLKQREELIADRFENVTVLFCDIVNFTNLSANITPEELVQNLNSIFTLFDGLTSSYRLEKIKTIGDAYMIVGGLPNPCDDHAERVANVALKMVKLVQIFSQEQAIPLSIRVGIHSGAVVAGVIGVTKFAYDLWGDTVNTASRMESYGKPNEVHCSESVYNLLKDKFSFEERGFIKIKGKGEMKTYFLKEKCLNKLDKNYRIVHHVENI